MKEAENIEDWMVHRFHRDLRRVIIRLATGKDTTPQLVKLRALVPGLAKLTPSELLERSKRPDGIDLGIVEGREAWKLQERLRPVGFALDITDASYVSHFPVKQGRPPMARIIEDEEEAEAFCLDLIARGCEVSDVES
jgi:hypothetical protein